MPVEMQTIPRVPLLRTGHVEAMSGAHDFTMEHLLAAVQAFENDPAVLAPRIHLGHSDPRFAEATRDLDGEPALGWFDNLTVDGNTLYGDAHMPAMLAEMAEWAYPSRSIEGTFGAVTMTGNVHDFMLTGVALLGVSLPAVQTLDDLRELGETAGAVSVALSADTVAKMPSTVVHAGLAAPDLPGRWYEAESAGELEGLPDSYDVWSWYVTETRIDDDGSLFLIVIDEMTSRLWRFNATVAGNDVSFAAPTEVIQQFVAASGRSGPRPRPALARFTSRRESRALASSSPMSHPNQEGDRPMTDEQRRAMALALGLPEDTAEDALHTAAAERAAQDTTIEAPEATTDDTPTPEAERELVAASESHDGLTITVSREVWEQTQRDATAGAAAREAQIRADRDQLVTAAVREGRITPAERDAWRRELDQAPDVVAGQLQRLPKGKVLPVAELGSVDASVSDDMERKLELARRDGRKQS